MHVLVTAASKHGSTAEIAEAVAKGLVDRGVEAALLQPDHVEDLHGYDAVVLGSAVYAGHWREAAWELFDRFRDELAERPVWLFSSGPVGDPPRPEEQAVEVAEIVRSVPVRQHRVFPGRIDERRLGLAERTLVRALRIPHGDWRDWDEIAAWAAHIAASLARRPS